MSEDPNIPRDTRTPARIAAMSALLVVFVIHLVGQLFAPGSFVTQGSQVLLMPALAAILLTHTGPKRSRLVTLTLTALFFSWVGDTLPRFLSGDASFLAMISGFLIAQVFYVLAFWPYRRSSVVDQPLRVAPYLAAAVVLLALCFDGAGALFIPVVLYAVVIVAMAVFATGLGPVATWGGIIFLVSDSLIALRSFADIVLPGHGFWVMLTYVLGQVLLVHAVQETDERDRRAIRVPGR